MLGVCTFSIILTIVHPYMTKLIKKGVLVHDTPATMEFREG